MKRIFFFFSSKTKTKRALHKCHAIISMALDFSFAINLMKLEEEEEEKEEEKEEKEVRVGWKKKKKEKRQTLEGVKGSRHSISPRNIPSYKGFQKHISSRSAQEQG